MQVNPTSPTSQRSQPLLLAKQPASALPHKPKPPIRITTLCSRPHDDMLVTDLFEMSKKGLIGDVTYAGFIIARWTRSS